MKVYQNTQYKPISQDIDELNKKNRGIPEQIMAMGEELEARGITEAIQPALTPEQLLHNAFKKVPMAQTESTFGIRPVNKA